MEIGYILTGFVVGVLIGLTGAYFKRNSDFDPGRKEGLLHDLSESDAGKRSKISLHNSLLKRITTFRKNPDEQGYPLLADEADRWEELIRQEITTQLK